jgi:hypothetical protein
MWPRMAEQPWEPKGPSPNRAQATRPHSDTSPETPDEDLPQDPGIPGGSPAPEPEREGGMQEPESPPDPNGIDAPDSPSEPPPIH